MQRITNIQELETAINQNGELVVSKNSKNNVIVMSMEEYRKKILKKEIEEHLLKAEEDIKNGRIKDARLVFKEWKEKYGI
ncbi:MAG: type II toxin-antitoxin system Phd/YefM family antitoxin [Clostridia bacterium]|nr:type II toxin-antitoxin system Phd/YefM family antitoxin [Clostridia bacterium]